MVNGGISGTRQPACLPPEGSLGHMARLYIT